MDAINFVLAVLALIVGGIAFARTGGIRMLHHRVEEARGMAADALERIEGKVRPHEEVPGAEGREERSHEERAASAPSR